MSEYAGQNKIAELIFCLLFWIVPAVMFALSTDNPGMLIICITCVTGMFFTWMSVILGDNVKENCIEASY